MSGRSPAEPLLEVRGLTVALAGRGRRTTILDGVDVTVGHGEIVGVVGESGSGKTVTMLSILGALPPELEPTVDRFRFDGEPCETAEERRRLAARRRMSLVPADVGASLNPLRRVGRQLDDSVRLRSGEQPRERRLRILGLLRRVGLKEPERSSRAYPHQLSGGMQQRAAIAMAIEPDPLLLIADEPTTALDVTIQAQVLRLLLDVREQTGCSILFVTHDITTVAEICDRVLVMYAGQVVEEGAVVGVCVRPRHPYTAALIDAVPPLGGAGPRRLRTIGGAPPEPGAWPSGCRFAPRCELRAALGGPDACTSEAPELRPRPDGGAARCHFSERLDAVRRPEPAGSVAP